VLLVEQGDMRVAVVTLDLCILETPCADLLRHVVAREACLSPQAVVLACSHTHSGPYPWRPEWENREPVPHPLLSEPSIRYAESLEQRLAEVSRAAAKSLCPAQMMLRRGAIAAGYTRRVPLADGQVGMAWDLREWEGPEPRLCDDPALQVLQIRREGETEILLWNAAAHAVGLGKRSNVVSADWPGAVRRQVEARLPGSRCLFLHGAGADVHPWLATGENPDDLEAVASPVSASIALLCGLPFHEQGGGLAWRQGEHLSAFRIGPVRLLAVDGEIFGRHGARLRRDFPDLLLATTANGWSGYWPPQECYPEGGHEVAAALDMARPPGAAEELMVECANNLAACG
jgi:hypothetical protein